jgi:hypothetical protein
LLKTSFGMERAYNKPKERSRRKKEEKTGVDKGFKEV